MSKYKVIDSILKSIDEIQKNNPPREPLMWGEEKSLEIMECFAKAMNDYDKKYVINKNSTWRATSVADKLFNNIKPMTKKELLEKINILKQHNYDREKEILILLDFKQEADSALKLHKSLFEKQTEINKLLAKELGGKIVEEDYINEGVDWDRGCKTKEIRTRQVFKKIELVANPFGLSGLNTATLDSACCGSNSTTTTKPKRKYTKRKK